MLLCANGIMCAGEDRIVVHGLSYFQRQVAIERQHMSLCGNDILSSGADRIVVHGLSYFPIAGCHRKTERMSQTVGR